MLSVPSNVHETISALFDGAGFDVRDAQLRITVIGNQCEGITFTIACEPAHRGPDDVYIGCVECGVLLITDMFSYIYLNEADLRYDESDEQFIVSFPAGMVGCPCSSSQVEPDAQN